MYNESRNLRQAKPFSRSVMLTCRVLWNVCYSLKGYTIIIIRFTDFVNEILMSFFEKFAHTPSTPFPIRQENFYIFPQKYCKLAFFVL